MLQQIAIISAAAVVFVQSVRRVTGYLITMIYGDSHRRNDISVHALGLRGVFEGVIANAALEFIFNPENDISAASTMHPTYLMLPFALSAVELSLDTASLLHLYNHHSVPANELLTRYFPIQHGVSPEVEILYRTAPQAFTR